ncbi:MAG TPA: hypothetical protein EYG13_00045 [Dehalococcoidia bacterium]|jgi:hypothetical protein|nr:hypothetical protein [Dehalococcoidia bacterium]
MSEVTELRALDREANFELGIETRFPLDLTSTKPTMWEAYEASLVQTWDPEDESLWSDFDLGEYTAGERAAGALIWSHRAWVEHSAIAESEAVLVRVCLETGVSADFKYCVSMRAVERARSTDLCHIFAARLDRYHSSPRTEELADLLNDELVCRVLHAKSDIGAYIGAHLVAQSTIDLRIWECARTNSDAGLGRVVDHVIRDKARMLKVAWLYMEDAVAKNSNEAHSLISSNVNYVLFEEEARGRQLPAFLNSGSDATGLAEANRIAIAGLGGVSDGDQHEIFEVAVDELKTKFASLGIEVGTRRDLGR